MAFADDSPSLRNVDCAASNGGESYCAHEWCYSLPAVNLWQHVIGLCLAAITIAFCQGLVQGIFNKVLGPKPQVKNTHAPQTGKI